MCKTRKVSENRIKTIDQDKSLKYDICYHLEAHDVLISNVSNMCSNLNEDCYNECTV